MQCCLIKHPDLARCKFFDRSSAYATNKQCNNCKCIKMTKHTIHDGVIKAVHEYDKQSASESIH